MNALDELLLALEDHWEDTITLKRNAFLVSKNTISTNLYLVKSGSLRVFIEDETEQHTIRFGYENSLITALDCFLTEKPTSFYIQAIKQCELKIISKSKYEEFINSKPEYRVIWKKLLESFV